MDIENMSVEEIEKYLETKKTENELKDAVVLKKEMCILKSDDYIIDRIGRVLDDIYTFNLNDLDDILNRINLEAKKSFQRECVRLPIGTVLRKYNDFGCWGWATEDQKYANFSDDDIKDFI